ncbi:hypothetical protein S40285_09361 [Stachybotrys chlorohalonatus IBT 40285]|uniref:Aflatoxin regulatory protein domain-containing protein n=1 Tax=Stachybotrys chlorohalonatus (strain IBT 40285) TaxID=1283841 RepID=A0A084R258_STAC4|nr:hypothetical protein S40285_09361 [Stachybotrys chlorohalonata IBT 40285]
MDQTQHRVLPLDHESHIDDDWENIDDARSIISLSSEDSDEDDMVDVVSEAVSLLSVAAPAENYEPQILLEYQAQENAACPVALDYTPFGSFQTNYCDIEKEIKKLANNTRACQPDLSPVLPESVFSTTRKASDGPTKDQRGSDSPHCFTPPMESPNHTDNTAVARYSPAEMFAARKRLELYDIRDQLIQLEECLDKFVFPTMGRTPLPGASTTQVQISIVLEAISTVIANSVTDWVHASKRLSPETTRLLSLQEFQELDSRTLYDVTFSLRELNRTLDETSSPVERALYHDYHHQKKQRSLLVEGGKLKELRACVGFVRSLLIRDG